MVPDWRPDSTRPLERQTLLIIGILAFAIVWLVPSLTSAQGFQQGVDFRNMSTFVPDPPGTYVVPHHDVPVNGVTFGWTTPSLVQGRDLSTSVNPRLAGTNFVSGDQLRPQRFADNALLRFAVCWCL